MLNDVTINGIKLAIKELDDNPYEKGLYFLDGDKIETNIIKDGIMRGNISSDTLISIDSPHSITSAIKKVLSVHVPLLSPDADTYNQFMSPEADLKSLLKRLSGRNKSFLEGLFNHFRRVASSGRGSGTNLQNLSAQFASILLRMPESNPEDEIDDLNNSDPHVKVQQKVVCYIVSHWDDLLAETAKDSKTGTEAGRQTSLLPEKERDADLQVMDDSTVEERSVKITFPKKKAPPSEDDLRQSLKGLYVLEISMKQKFAVVLFGTMESSQIFVENWTDYLETDFKVKSIVEMMSPTSPLSMTSVNETCLKEESSNGLAITVGEETLHDKPQASAARRVEEEESGDLFSPVPEHVSGVGDDIRNNGLDNALPTTNIVEHLEEVWNKDEAVEEISEVVTPYGSRSKTYVTDISEPSRWSDTPPSIAMDDTKGTLLVAMSAIVDPTTMSSTASTSATNAVTNRSAEKWTKAEDPDAVTGTDLNSDFYSPASPHSQSLDFSPEPSPAKEHPKPKGGMWKEAVPTETLREPKSKTPGFDTNPSRVVSFVDDGLDDDAHVQRKSVGKSGGTDSKWREATSSSNSDDSLYHFDDDPELPLPSNDALELDVPMSVDNESLVARLAETILLKAQRTAGPASGSAASSSGAPQLQRRSMPISQVNANSQSAPEDRKTTGRTMEQRFVAVGPDTVDRRPLSHSTLPSLSTSVLLSREQTNAAVRVEEKVLESALEPDKAPGQPVEITDKNNMQESSNRRDNALTDRSQQPLPVKKLPPPPAPVPEAVERQREMAHWEASWASEMTLLRVRCQTLQQEVRESGEACTRLRTEVAKRDAELAALSTTIALAERNADSAKAKAEREALSTVLSLQRLVTLLEKQRNSAVATAESLEVEVRELRELHSKSTQDGLNWKTRALAAEQELFRISATNGERQAQAVSGEIPDNKGHAVKAEPLRPSEEFDSARGGQPLTGYQEADVDWSGGGSTGTAALSPWLVALPVKTTAKEETDRFLSLRRHRVGPEYTTDPYEVWLDDDRAQVASSSKHFGRREGISVEAHLPITASDFDSERVTDKHVQYSRASQADSSTAVSSTATSRADSEAEQGNRSTNPRPPTQTQSLSAQISQQLGHTAQQLHSLASSDHEKEEADAFRSADEEVSGRLGIPAPQESTALTSQYSTMREPSVAYSLRDSLGSGDRQMYSSSSSAVRQSYPSGTGTHFSNSSGVTDQRYQSSYSSQNVARGFVDPRSDYLGPKATQQTFQSRPHFGKPTYAYSSFAQPPYSFKRHW